MTKLDAGLITSLPASDPGSAAVWDSKRINPWPQSCLYLAWSGCPSNDDDDGPHHETIPMGQNHLKNKYCWDKCVPIKKVEKIQYGVTKIYPKHIYDIDFLVLN